MRDQYKMKYFVLLTGWVIANVANPKSVTEIDKIHQRVTSAASQVRNSEECPVNYFKNNDGTCVECSKGSYGKQCSKNCPDGFYGRLCILKCNCKTGEACDKYLGCKSSDTEATVTGSQVYYDTSMETNVGERITAYVIIEQDLGSSTTYQDYLRYTGGGLALVLIISVFTIVVLKRSWYKARLSRIAVRDVETIEEVALHTSRDAIESSARETMYSNVYLEIIDLESVDADQCNGYEEVSQRSFSDTESDTDGGYLEVIATVEK